MGCACSTITLERVPTELCEVSFEIVRPERATITWEMVCATVVDLVAFSAADGHFFTSEGYTIIVKR